MRQGVRTAALALALALSVGSLAFSADLPGLNVLSDRLAAAASLPQPTNVTVVDRPGDDGTALLVLFDITVAEGQLVYVMPLVQVDGGAWQPTDASPLAVDSLGTVKDLPQVFGHRPQNPDARVITIDKILAEPAQTPATPEAAAPEPGAVADGTAPAAEGESQPLVAGTTYAVRLLFAGAGEQQLTVDAGNATVREELFTPSKLNILVISLLFTAILMTATGLARRNPGKLFIRRIAGLEAVEEAIGRATEMGKPVMQINGLDPLTTPSTIAAVNILGQIARKVAHYDSRLMVPSFDPVVMTVSQETVKQAYMEEGRPDAYREEDIFFVTDQQFSYVASVCGLMLREKPAANFFLGYFYAEALLLAETGQSTGAIQIAGTDAQAQLPFFITTCDYTLIGEEIYAASAYLSREPILLGGLKGIDASKVIIMLLILVGSILATFGITFLTELLTPLS